MNSVIESNRSTAVTQEPPRAALPFNWVVAHRDARRRGPRPTSSWLLFKNYGEEWAGMAAEDPENAPRQLRELVASLNGLDGQAEWNDVECGFVRLELVDPTIEIGDFTTRTDFAAREIEIRRHVGGWCCDQWLAKEAPNLAAFIASTLPPRRLLAAEQAEVDRRAAAKAEADSALAAQVEADEREYALATGSFLDSQNKKLPDRLRAANLAQCVKALLDNPRLFKIADREQAFFDATGKDFAAHGHEYEESPAAA